MFWQNEVKFGVSLDKVDESSNAKSNNGSEGESSLANEILEKIAYYGALGYEKFWEFLESLPIEPSTTLSIAGVIFFILIISCCCIICRFCCKKKDVRKQTKEKLDLRKDHLFGPNYAERIQTRFDEIDYNLESTMFDALAEIKLGQVKFSLDFDNEENIVEVTIHEAKDIPAADISGFSDAFVKISLKPASKKEYRTETIKSTLAPVYEEIFYFKKVSYAALTASVLSIKVYDEDRFDKTLLGEANVPINDLDLTKGKITQWRVIVPEFKSEAGRFGKNLGLGHICIAIGYSPNSNVLAIFILSCKDLQAVDEGGFSDPYITFFLIQDGKKIKKRKTTVKLRTLNPAFNESFAFEIDFDKIEEISLMFVVADYDPGSSGEPMGQCIIGQLGQGLGAKHWEKMRRSPGKPVAFWHMLKPVPKAE